MPPVNKPPPVPQTDEERRQLLERFIKVNNPRRQLFDGIWWSEGQRIPRIKRHAAAEIERIGWTEIVALVEKAEGRNVKPQPRPAKPQPRPAKTRPSERRLAEYRARRSRSRDQ